MARTKTKPAPEVETVDQGDEPAAAPPVDRPIGTLTAIPVDAIDAAPNVRTEVGDVAELAESIRTRGLLEPIRVTPAGDDRFLLVFGQRRLAAVRLLGLETIAALVADDDGERALSDVTIDQLVENVQRADLNPLDRAHGYASIIERSGMTQAELARQLGLAPSTISNALRILDTIPAVQEAVAKGAITASHAKAIAGLTPKYQETVASSIRRDVEAGKPVSSHELEQSIKWRADEQSAAEKRDAATSKIVDVLLFPKLEEAGVAKGDPVLIDGNGYSLNIDAIAKAAEAAGYPRHKDLTSSYSNAAPEGGCSCVAWIVNVVSNRKPSIKPACIVRAHREKAGKAADAAERRAEKDRETRATAIREHVDSLLLPGILAVYEGLPRPALELLAGDKLGYGITYEGAVAKISKAKASDLAATLIEGHSLGHGYSYLFRTIDLEAAIAELGIPDPVAPIALPAPAEEAATDATPATTGRKRGKRTKTEPVTDEPAPTDDEVLAADAAPADDVAAA